MSDNFYDFDKEDAFDEVYLKKSGSAPQKKEFEIEIPMPDSALKSSMPKPQTPHKATPVPQKRKKLSSTALTLIVIGIVFSCILTFLLSFVGTVFGWKYLPNIEQLQQEDSVVDDIEQIQEYIEISDDGTSVEVVPMYKPSGNSSSSSEKDSSEKDSKDSSDAKDTDDEKDTEEDASETDSYDDSGSSSDNSVDDETIIEI